LFRNRVVREFEKTNEHECKELLAKIGLKGRENSSADRISLGQTKRVAIARTIRAGARIIFLDEPLSGLDADGIGEAMTLLTSLAQRERITLVIVEHIFNIPRILKLAQTVWTLRDGKIQIETAHRVSQEASTGFDSVAHKLLDQFSGSDGRIHKQKFNGGGELIRITNLATNQNQTPILDVRSMVVRRNHRLVLGQQTQEDTVNGLSFTLSQGDVAILCAPNGWGKTTLFEALSGIIPTAHGQVLIRGMDTLRLATWNRARLGLRLISARDNMFPNLSVADFLALRRVTAPQVDRFPGPRRLIGELSGGERKQLALSDLSTPGSLVMLDEPFLGLDSEAVTATCKRLDHFIKNLSGTLLIALPATLSRSSNLN